MLELRASKSFCGVNAWDSRSPPSPSAAIPAGFHSQELWGLLPALEPWAMEPGVGLESPYPLWGDPHSQDIAHVC